MHILTPSELWPEPLGSDPAGDPEAAWAAVEFAAAQLGDARRTARLVELATTLGARPSASLPQASQDTATLKAAYRFFDNPAIEPHAMLESHVAATVQRMQRVPLVLMVQDTSLLDWTHHPATTGLGPLAQAHRHGLLVHSTLAMVPERLPLGVVAQQVWARDAATWGQQVPHQERSLEDKESHKWVLSLEAVNALAPQCPHTHLLSVCDREGDIYALWMAPRAPNVDLLVRAAWDRGVVHAQDEPSRLWGQVEAAPIAATTALELPRRAATAKHPAQPARTATVSVRWSHVLLRPPRAWLRQGRKDWPEVAAWAILVREEEPPTGMAPVEWLLLTTCAVHETSQALQRVEWYACRWGIEVWHKVLKSGCRIEARQLESAARLERCLALYSVIAWRLLYSTMLARAVPDAPCTVLLEEEEWQALYCRVHGTTVLPAEPPSLREAVRAIARLGGFLGRSGDGEPGVTVLWRGFEQLHELTALYRILRPPAPHSRDVGKD